MEFCRSKLTRHQEDGQLVYYDGQPENYELVRGVVDERKQYLRIGYADIDFKVEDNGKISANIEAREHSSKRELAKRERLARSIVRYIEGSLKKEPTFMLVLKQLDPSEDGPAALLYEQAHSAPKRTPSPSTRLYPA